MTKKITFFYKNFRAKLALYYATLVLCVALTFVIPIFTRSFIDACISQKTIFNFSFASLIFLSCAELIICCIKDECNVRLSNKIAFKIEYDVTDHIKRSEYEKVKKYDDTYLAQRINNDSVIIGDYICEKLPYFCMNALLIILITLYTIFLDFTTGILFGVFAVLYIAMYFLLKKRLSALAEKMFDSQARFFSMLSGQINGILLIKINSWYEEKNAEFKEITKDFYGASIPYLRLEFIIKNAGVFLGRCLTVLSLCRIGFSVLHGSDSISAFATLILYVGIFISKLNETNTFGDSREQFMLAKKRLNELYSTTAEKNGTKEIAKIKSIRTRGLSCAFENRTLRYPNIEFNEGGIYILKGENGSGKSTFINLILGIIKQTEGAIFYNGYDLSEIELTKVKRKNIAVKNQEPYIVQGTLLKNLEFGNDKFSSSTSVPHKIVELLAFAENRGKMNLAISSKNTELSGGEKQRVAISRAFCKDADFIILDEPTNGLDTEAKSVLKGIIKNLQNKIVLIITHSTCFDDIADSVITL